MPKHIVPLSPRPTINLRDADGNMHLGTAMAFEWDDQTRAVTGWIVAPDAPHSGAVEFVEPGRVENLGRHFV